MTRGNSNISPDRQVLVNAVIGQVTFAAWRENPPYLDLFQAHLCDGLDPTRRESTSEFDPRISQRLLRSRFRQDTAAGRGEPRPLQGEFLRETGNGERIVSLARKASE